MIARHPWLSVAIAIFGVAWGANQFAPMLRFYTTTVGLSEATVSATFGIYGVGVATQPIARHIGNKDPAILNRLGLVASTFAFALGAAYTGTAASPLLYLACIVAGIAYGMNLLYGFLALGHAPRGVRVAQYYVFVYVGFAFPPVIVSLGEHVPVSAVLLCFAGLTAALALVPRAAAVAAAEG